ncbi:MAG: U32 family peptidase, partial [Muribaculaceae bacterium]|nr:U32 family peptidase [Muribaculaceae bacterium]
MSGVRTLELLAPARDAATGRIAVLAGADAVYIGAPAFGARAAATNSVADIAELAAFAHVYRAKVYVTMNTILYDDELERARKMVWELYKAGVDALIVQDMAYLEMELPPIALHASTQC